MKKGNILNLALATFWLGDLERKDHIRKRPDISESCRKGNHVNCFEHGCKCECHGDDFTPTECFW